MLEVVSVEQPASFVTENPFGDIWPSVCRGSDLPLGMEVSQRFGKFSRHINPPNFSALGRRHFAMGVVSLYEQEAVLEVEVTPLKGQKFAKTEAGPGCTEEQWIVPSRVPRSCGQEERDFLTGEWIDLSMLGNLRDKFPWLEGDIDGEQVIFDGLAEEAA